MVSQIDITNIIAEINGLLPQLSNFITQFNNLINQNNVNIIFDAMGNMSLDAPGNMTDLEINFLSKRVNVIDALITSHKSSITNLFQQVSNIDKGSNITNSSNITELTSLRNQFEILKTTYKN